MNIRLSLLAGILASASFISAYATPVGTDDASASAYADGWQVGDNGSTSGNAFGAWTIGWSGRSMSIGDSAANGDGDNGSPVGTAGDGDIGNPAWIYELDGADEIAHVIRPFNGALLVGQTFFADIDLSIGTAPEPVFSVELEGAASEWQLFWTFDSPFFFIEDGNGTTPTSLPFSDEGLRIAFTLTAVGFYTAELSLIGTSLSETLSGPLQNGGDIEGVLFGIGTGFAGGSLGMAINNLAIVPEPSVGLLLAMGLCVLARSRLSRRSPA